MISVTKIEASSFDLDHVNVFWEIGPVPGPMRDTDPHSIFEYQFFVLRSDAMMGPYTLIAGPLRDQYSLRDIQVSLLHGWRDLFYKIKVLHVPTGESVEFGPASLTIPEPDLIAAEIIRQEDVLFREFIGRKCWLFPARTFGPCCSCYDVHLGRRTRSGHALCFDTGFLGGFLLPVEVFVQIDPPGKNVQATPLVELQAGDAAARMISFPPVNPKDILVESENVRWKVIRVSYTQRLRSTVHQELVLHAIPKGDIEFNIPIRVDPHNIGPSAERNFTNPSNLKSDDDLTDIFDFWDCKARGALR